MYIYFRIFFLENFIPLKYSLINFYFSELTKIFLKSELINVNLIINRF